VRPVWQSRDGYPLVLPAGTLARLVARGRADRPGYRPPSGDEAQLRERIRGAVGRIARSARRTGSLRHVHTGVPWPLFQAQIGRRGYRLVTRHLAGGGYAIFDVQAPHGSPGFLRPPEAQGRGSGAEYSDSWAHRQTQQEIINQLRDQGARRADIRDNRGQVRSVTGARGAAFPNQPDISYVAEGNQRVNVEIDTRLATSLDHERQLIAQDPNAMHIFLLVDRDGSVRGRRVYDPLRDGSRDPAQRRARAERPSSAVPRPRSTQLQLPGFERPVPQQMLLPLMAGPAARSRGRAARPGPARAPAGGRRPPVSGRR
jgi:hypothetical protein